MYKLDLHKWRSTPLSSLLVCTRSCSVNLNLSRNFFAKYRHFINSQIWNNVKMNGVQMGSSYQIKWETKRNLKLIFLSSISLGLKVNLKRNEWQNQVMFYQKICSLFGNKILIPFLLYFALHKLVQPLGNLGFFHWT